MSKEMFNGRKIPEAIIFDLDGSLVDSMWMWKAIDIEYLAGLGYPEVPKDLAGEIEGMSYRETACYFKKRFQISASEEEIMDTWTRMSYEKYRFEVTLKPGAAGLLEWAKKEGISLGIATSNARILAEAALTGLQILDLFPVLVTGEDVKKGKPAPDSYLLAAKRLGADPACCLVFEDIPAGILAGKAAGMTVIAVDDAASGELESVKRELADGFIRSFDELFEKEGLFRS